ncbi:MAG TPA: ubiquitin-conjugating enzyme E2 [Anaerolineae bacterium]|nr:ubiquitin-conjugating enzyme E2 [Anaerolineae bacterium]
MTFNMRETRLKNDYEHVKGLTDRSEFIHIVKTEGSPPEKYVIRYTCNGVEKVAPSGRPVLRDVHEVSMYLHAEYPLKQPQLKWLTPIYHPNIHVTGAVCIGAWWPAKTLDELLLTLGQMIQYKNFDPQDPMNSRAANWALRQKHLFPVDNRELKGPSLSDLIKIGETESDELNINFL